MTTPDTPRRQELDTGDLASATLIGLPGGGAIHFWRGPIPRPLSGHRTIDGLCVHAHVAGVATAGRAGSRIRHTTAPGRVLISGDPEPVDWLAATEAQDHIHAATVLIPRTALLDLLGDPADAAAESAIARLSGRFDQAIDGLAPQIVARLARSLDPALSGLQSRLSAQSAAIDVLALILRRTGDPDPGSGDGAIHRRRADLVAATKIVLADHLDDPPSLSTLARRLGVSVWRLRRDFQAIEGMTPSRWLHGARMARAQALLADSDLSIAEIGYRIGYASPCNFTTAFARTFGCAPSQARRRR